MKKLISIILLVCFVATTLFTRVYATENVERTDEISNETEDFQQNTIDNYNDDTSLSNDVQQDEELSNQETEIKEGTEIKEDNEVEGSSDQIITNNEQDNIDENPEIIKPTISYTTHIQDIGWKSYVDDGGISGTTGLSKRLEGIKIKLSENSYAGNISYSTHIQNIGWTSYVSNGTMSGTSGKSLRLEAIKIKLEGDISNYYDIYYRVHAQNFGWLDWASNGMSAGSQSYGYRLEAIQIVLVAKGEAAPGKTSTPFKSPGKVYYSTHVQDIGWTSNVGDGKTSGTVGKSKRIEAIRIQLSGLQYKGDIEYSSHIQNIGWQSYRNNEKVSGTSGKSLRVEAMRIRLTGEVANYYDIYYRVHAQNFGWLSWAKNDEKAGSEEFGNRLEAIQIVLVEKGGAAPGDTTKPYIGVGEVYYSSHVQNISWMPTVSNGETSGTIGASKRLEAIRISLGKTDYTGSIEYSTHIQDVGWQNYVSNGAISGTQNQSKRIEAIKIKLTGDISNYYNINYRVYCQQLGWLGWTSNNRIAGTTGGSFRIEAIQIKLYPKGVSNIENSSKASLSFVNKNGFKVCYDANGRLYEDAEPLIGKTGSYTLRVNKSTNVVTALVSNGEGIYNIAMKRFICSVGNDTPVGTFYTPAKYRWRELMGPSYGQFSTRIVGGILFHSVPYNKMDNRTLSARMYNQLGTTCSHGCVRLTCGDAKWIYDNCPLYTRVDIVSGGADPLSKPTAQKIPLNQTWDPTDPTL